VSHDSSVETSAPPRREPIVDLAQWRALVVAFFKTDLRTTSRALDFGNRTGGSAALVGLLLVLAIMGGGVAFLIASVRDLYLSGTLFLTVLGFILATSLLIEYHSVVLSPADYRQLAFQPLSSRTFLAARVTSAFLYMFVLTMAYGVGPVATFAVIAHGGVAVAMAAVLAASGLALAVTLAVLTAYVGILHIVSPHRLRSALSYLQLVLLFVVYGSWAIVPLLLQDRLLASAALPKAWWTLINPATWYACWINLAAGDRAPLHVAGVAMSLAAPLALAMLAGGRLSLDFGERLVAMDTSATGAVRPLGRGRLFRDGEERAIALLVGAQFRYDTRFRLAVLSIVPLTAFYLLIGMGEGDLNPFSSQDRSPRVLYVAVLMFPMLLRTAFTQSDAYRAAWIFQGTSAHKPSLVLALARLVFSGFILPYLVVLSLVFAFAIRNPAALYVHMLTLGLISYVMVQIDFLLQPAIPFSRPPSHTVRGRVWFVTLFLASFVGSFLSMLLAFAYQNRTRVAVTLIALAGLAVLLHNALRSRLNRLDAHAEFDM
jgi:hypothetical protein